MASAARMPITWFKIVLCVLLFSCGEKDELPPEVQFIAPLENASFAVFDTISLGLTAVDDETVEWVSVKLVDLNMIAVTPSSFLARQGNGNGWTGELIIEDKQLPSGDYILLATAFDGANEKRVFRTTRVSALPKKRRAVFVAGERVYRIDSSFQLIQPFLDPQQDILSICVNSDLDRLTLVGEYSTGISTHATAGGATIWQDEVFPVAQTPRYRSLACSENEIYVSLYDREIRAYTSAGTLMLNMQTGDHRPALIGLTEGFVLVETELVGTSQRFLDVFNRQTRALLNRLPLDMDVVSICRLSETVVFLFGNDDGQAVVWRYDISTNGYWEPRELPDGSIFKAVSMDGQRFALAHENGLYAYTYSPNYLNSIRPGVLYADLAYDVDRNTLVAATGNTVEELTTDGTVLHTLAAPEPIRSMAIHYTK